MSLFPDDQLQPTSPPAKLTAEQRRAREADRLTMIRLRMAIWRILDDQGVTDPAAIGAAPWAAGGQGLLAEVRVTWC
jgi:hypothetical protein